MTSDSSESTDWFDWLRLAGTFLLLSVAWGVVYSVLSPIFASVQWISGLLGWVDSDLGWIGLFLKNLKFGWTVALFFVTVIASYSLLGALVFIAFLTTRRYNDKRLAYFADQHPLVYEDLEEKVGSISTHIAVWWLCSVGVWISAYVAYFFGVRSATWVVAGSVTATLGVFYGAMLIDARNLGRWAFQHVRGFIFPYVFVVAPMFVAFGFLTLLQNDIMTGFLAYFGADSADIQSMVLLDFEWEPVDVLRASVTSLGGLLMVVWLIPILIKRDFMELVAVAMALASPWLGEMLLEQTEVPQQQVAQMLDIVPLPVLALTAAMMVDRLFGGIKSVVTTTYRCPVCGNRTSPTIRFCPQCGTPVSDDMSEDSAPSST